MNPDDYLKKIESDILIIIEEKLVAGEMDVKRAKAIARMVLEKLHPPLTLEQIYKIAPTLDDEFTELARAVLPVISDQNKQIGVLVANHAKKLIASGKFEEATVYMKKNMQNESSVMK